MFGSGSRTTGTRYHSPVASKPAAGGLADQRREQHRTALVRSRRRGPHQDHGRRSTGDRGSSDMKAPAARACNVLAAKRGALASADSRLILGRKTATESVKPRRQRMSSSAIYTLAWSTFSAS
jgi:hypothetical protein